MGWQDDPVSSTSWRNDPVGGLQSARPTPVPQELSPGVIRPGPYLGVLGRGIEALSPGTGTALEEFSRKALLPTALTALAPELGAARGIGLLGKMLLESGGNVAGEAINQAAGITPESKATLGLSALVPPAGRLGMGLLAKGAQAGARNLPGAPVVLNELAAQEAAALPKAYAGPVTARAMFQSLEGTPAQLDARDVLGTVTKHLDDELRLSKGAQNNQVITYLTGLKDKITQTGGDLKLLDLHDEMVRLGELRRAAERAGGPELGTYKDVFKSFSTALNEGAVKSPGDVAQLRLARQTAKREFALNDLEDWIQTATKTNRGQGENVQFNANYVMNKIKNDNLFGQSLGKAEQTEIMNALTRLNTIPVLDAPANVMIGSGKMLGKYAAAGATGTALGGPGGAALGVAAMWLGPKVVAWAVGTPLGRQTMAKVLTANKGILDRRGAAILAAGAEGGMQ